MLRGRLSATLPLDRKLAGLLYRSGIYTAKYSLKEIRHFAGEEVPRPRLVDDGVSDVRFVADLGKTTSAPTMMGADPTLQSMVHAYAAFRGTASYGLAGAG